MTFFSEAAERYQRANAATLDWMLSRPRLGPGFLDTKLNSLTLADYSQVDGLRGPAYTYGWIQARGLEAIATHAAFFADRRPELSRRLDEAGRSLYEQMKDLQGADGHVYFRYNAQMEPVRAMKDGTLASQLPAGDIFTFSDAFAAKGLVRAAARYAPTDMPTHIAYLTRVIEAVEDSRFQIDEQAPLGPATTARQPDDFGPRMILLGAAGMLEGLGVARHTAFAGRFVRHVIDRHLDSDTHLLRNVPGGDECNVGHGIEFAGFALDHAPTVEDRELVRLLERIMLASVDRGFTGTGLALTVSVSSGKKLSPYRPWWSLPETVRTAALAYDLTGNTEVLAAWQRADAAFFRYYWRGNPPIAYQTLTADGPTDYIPATPDLDPGYHTGLSLLAAVPVAERQAAPSAHPATR